MWNLNNISSWGLTRRRAEAAYEKWRIKCQTKTGRNDEEADKLRLSNSIATGDILTASIARRNIGKHHHGVNDYQKENAGEQRA